MIRQARQYLFGAMSGATLIAIAIGAFVVLVSTQVFGDWPLGGLIGGGERPAVSRAQEVSTASGGAGAAEAAAGEGGAGTAAAGGKGGTGGGGAAGGGSGSIAGGEGSGQSGGNGGGEGSAGGGGGEGGGGSAPTQSPSGSGGSGGSGGTASSGGGSGGSGGSGETTTSSPSAPVTGTVNETVHTVDENVTGGTLEATGATGVTEEVVESVAGPESTVGKTVDEAGKTVEGVLGK